LSFPVIKKTVIRNLILKDILMPKEVMKEGSSITCVLREGKQCHLSLVNILDQFVIYVDHCFLLKLSLKKSLNQNRVFASQYEGTG
jgi:hypothetical protein